MRKITWRIVQFLPAFIIAVFLWSVFSTCNPAEPKWEPLEAKKLVVSPSVIYIGEPVTIMDGICSRVDYPIDVLINMSVQSVPPQAGASIPVIVDQRITLKKGECTKSESTAESALPIPSFQSGAYRLSLVYRTTTTTDKGTMKNQIIVLTSNDFQVVVPRN